MGPLGIWGPLRAEVVIWEPRGTFGDRGEPLGGSGMAFLGSGGPLGAWGTFGDWERAFGDWWRVFGGLVDLWGPGRAFGGSGRAFGSGEGLWGLEDGLWGLGALWAVSYTHLTLPTTPYV